MLDQTLDALGSCLENANLNYGRETHLQEAIADALYPRFVAREHVLSDGYSRIDLIVITGDDVVGIEVKIDGAIANVVKQLTRYAACPELDALILVTTRAAHNAIPSQLNGKPVRLHTLLETGL